VLGAERLRAAGRAPIAACTEQLTRLVFLLGVALTLVAAIALCWDAIG
jgi:hypothetical protein